MQYRQGIGDGTKMAERRMFAKTIVLSDAFLDMPLGSRCLYMTLSMVADDDGFVNSPRAIMRQCGATDDDMKVLIAKKFIIPFDSGIIVIKHLRINNYIRSDRYQETKYLEEKAHLYVDEKGAYKYVEDASGIPSIGIPSIGKDRLGKDRVYKGKNAPDMSLSNNKSNPNQIEEARGKLFGENNDKEQDTENH
jgi:hypothetical protein